MKVEILRLDSDLPLPTYAQDADAGLDLLAAEDTTLAPGQRAGIRTGIAVAIPEGYAGFVLPRSRTTGAKISVYQPPPGQISTTVSSGSTPKKARVSDGCR